MSVPSEEGMGAEEGEEEEDEEEEDDDDGDDDQRQMDEAPARLPRDTAPPGRMVSQIACSDVGVLHPLSGMRWKVGLFRLRLHQEAFSLCLPMYMFRHSP